MASKSFDIHDMHLQPMWFKLLLAVLIIVVILGAAYLYKYREQLEELEIKKAEEENTLKPDYSEKTRKAAMLPVLEAELKQLEEAFAILVKKLPTDAEVPNLIQELNQAGSNNSLQMSSTRPLKTEKDDAVEILPYAISTSGSYDQFTSFAKDVGGLSRIIVLDALNVTTDSNGKIKLEARANTYKASKDYVGNKKPADAGNAAQ